MLYKFLLLVLLIQNVDAHALQVVCEKNVDEPLIGAATKNIGANWNDPHALHLGEFKIVYASANNDFDKPVNIYRLISKDGKEWHRSPDKPTFSPSKNKDDWDSGGVETAAVIWFKGKSHLFYTGYQGAHSNITSFKVGHAVSDDGLNWQDRKILVKPSTNPQDFYSFIVAEPAPVVFKDILYVYFTAVGVNPILKKGSQMIGVITTKDGVNWTKPQLALLPDQNIYPIDKNWMGYSTPHAAVIDEKVHLFFDVVTEEPWNQEKLHHAYSADGLTGWIHDKKAFLEKEDFDWTEREIRAPSIVSDGTGKAITNKDGSFDLWFAGDNFSFFNRDDFGIAKTKCYFK